MAVLHQASKDVDLTTAPPAFVAHIDSAFQKAQELLHTRNHEQDSKRVEEILSTVGELKQMWSEPYEDDKFVIPQSNAVQLAKATVGK